jgi:hypothetical protein
MDANSTLRSKDGVKSADRQRALDAGFNHHFVKTVDIQALERLLSSPQIIVDVTAANLQMSRMRRRLLS